MEKTTGWDHARVRTGAAGRTRHRGQAAETEDGGCRRPSTLGSRPGLEECRPTRLLYFVAAVTLLAPLALQADSLAGRVLDPQGRAVANARLRLFDRDSGELRKTLSGGDGSYVFRSLQEGDYLLEAEAADSALIGSQDLVIRGDETSDLELAVSGATVRVVVTASSTPLPVNEIAKALDVVDAEQMALRDEFAISEAVRSVPGLRVRQLRGPGGTTTIQARGLRTQDTAVLIDGLRFRDAAGTQGDASAFLQEMHVVDADRVEFLRGSGSSLYGSHAMAGVMNIQSRQGGGRPHGEIRAEGGGLGMLRGVARVGGGLAEDRFVYSGGVSHANFTRGYRDAGPYRNSGAQGFAKYNFTPNVSLSGRIWAADAFVSVNESPAFTDEILDNFPADGPVPARALPNAQLARFEAGRPFEAGSATFIPDQTDPDGRRSSRFVAAALSLQHQLTPDSSYRLAYQLVDSRRTFRDGPAGPGAFEPLVSNNSRFDGRTDTFQARTDHRIGLHNLVSFGYELENEQFLNFNTDEGAAPVESRVDIEQASHAVFAQDQIRLLEGNLQLSLSGRAQRFYLATPRFSGSRSPYEPAGFDSPPSAYTGDAAAAYFFRSSRTKLRAHVGNSFRAPSLFERFGGTFSSFSGGFDYWGDPRLSPERSVAVDGGVDQWLYGAKVRLSATAFYTNLQQTVIFDFANFPLDDLFGRFGGYRNSSGGIARGAEFSARVAPSSTTSVDAAYTYTNSDSRTPTIGSDYFGMLGVSDHVFTMTATQWIARRFNVTFDLFAASENTFSPFGANGRRLVFAGPVKADVVVRYDIPLSETRALEFYGKVENLFDHRYYELGYGAPGAWAIAGLRFRF